MFVDSDMNTGPHAFWSGVRGMLPILLGVIPFGLIYGVLAIEAGLPVAQAQSMSFIVFAGSAQFIATQLFATDSPALILVATTFIVNLRHLLYSASLMPSLKGVPRRWQYLAAYLLTDEAYAVTASRFEQGTSRFPHFYLIGCGLALWVSWQISTTVGILLGAAVPASWQLDYALPVTFIALIMPLLHRRPHLAAAIVAGIVAWSGQSLPYKLGLMLATSLGITTGVVLERWGARSGHG